MVTTAHVLHKGGFPEAALKTTFRFAVALLPVVFLLSLSACGNSDPVVIGFLGGLSGKMSDIGTYGRDGAILAVETRNGAGGIGGRQVLLDVRDDGQDPVRAAAMMDELADRGALAVVGPVTSAMAVAAVPVANRRKLAMVSPTVTTDALSGKDDYFMRVVPSVERISARMADHLYDHEGLRSIATICDMNNRAYTENWTLRFKERFESKGGRVVASESFVSSPDLLFLPLAKKLSASGAEAILISANAVDAAMMCQQLRKIGWNKPVAVVEWASSEKFLNLGGTSVEGVFVSQFFDRESRLPRYLAFVESYRKRFGVDPGFASVLGYDAANVVMDALARGGGRGGASIKAQILSSGMQQGLQNAFSIDAFGDIAASAGSDRDNHIAVVRGGAYRVIR